MSDKPKRGKRVQIYLPADLLKLWEQTPRYERSATVATALRRYWQINVAMNVANTESSATSPHQEDQNTE